MAEKVQIDWEAIKRESAYAAALQRLFKGAIASGMFEVSQRAVEIEAEMESIFHPLVNVLGRNGEDRSCALFDYGINSGLFDAKLHPCVVSVKKEYQLRAGRVDRLLEHADGSFTVVEIKPSGSRRDQAQGLGQSIVYASSLRSELNDVRDVRAALFVSADHDIEIASACKSVGVEYLCFPKEAQKLVDELAGIHRIGGGH